MIIASCDERAGFETLKRVMLDMATGGPCRIAAKRLTLTDGAYRVGVRMPDRGQAAASPTSRRRGHWPLPPANAARANGGTGAEMAAPAVLRLRRDAGAATQPFF